MIYCEHNHNEISCSSSVSNFNGWFLEKYVFIKSSIINFLYTRKIKCGTFILTNFVLL